MPEPTKTLPIVILKKTMAQLQAKIASERESIAYHEGELEGIRTRATSYAEQIEALRSTIELLEKV